ncbi:P-loop containing nucleoside triphosphate hydrolase protein [Lactifluus subvellereus]|nr:P-loop containing nucleoside triphosphate hydrolase protein [Lactifluus subvellereus]
MRRMPRVEPLCALRPIDNNRRLCSATTTIFPDSLRYPSSFCTHFPDPKLSMPSHSPTRSAAARSSSFRVDQTFIDEPIDPIDARIVHEKDLEATDLEWFLGPDVNSPRSVGISPAYSQSGGLPALACALGTRVLIINFHSSKVYRDGNPSGTRQRNIERRNRLEEELLCHPYYTLYAFDLAQVALSLRLHLRIHLANAIDIQSALPVPSRDVIDAVKIIVDDASPIWEDNIISTFESTLYESNKEKDLTSLVQRAWLCGYLGQYDIGNIKDMFYKAPKVDMRKFSEEELDVLQKMAYDMLRLDNMKPQSVTHEITTRWDPKSQRMVAQSQRYANRLTANSSVKVTLAYGSSTFNLAGETAARVRGKSAPINMEHNLEGKDITAITTLGRDAPTRAEFERHHAILRMLQGSLPLFDNHWMQAIWFPSQPVTWPESFSTPPDPPTIEIVKHDKAQLNSSQISALTNMLSPSLDNCITVVKGPPGTGKTTVIATYVLSAIQAGQRGIWLMAQSNVAVKNIAEKLVDFGFLSFKLIVSDNFHYQWHEHLYNEIKNNIIISSQLPKPSALKRALKDSQVLLCTVDMLSNPKLQDFGLTQAVPIMNVVIDEASQIEIGQYVPLFKSFGKTLRKICFIGDENQLPPHAQDNLGNLQSVFELDHLKESATRLDTQYRMPPQIGEFISQHVYEGKLKSNPSHRVKSSTIACYFVDVNGVEQLDKDGKSSFVSSALVFERTMPTASSEPAGSRGDCTSCSAPPGRGCSLQNYHSIRCTEERTRKGAQ